MKIQKLTQEQALVVSGFTGVLAITPFRLFHADVEKRLGRPIFTHEMGDEKVSREIKEAYRRDFQSLCADKASCLPKREVRVVHDEARACYTIQLFHSDKLEAECHLDHESLAPFLRSWLLFGIIN